MSDQQDAPGPWWEHDGSVYDVHGHLVVEVSEFEYHVDTGMTDGRREAAERRALARRIAALPVMERLGLAASEAIRIRREYAAASPLDVPDWQARRMRAIRENESAMQALEDAVDALAKARGET